MEALFDRNGHTCAWMKDDTLFDLAGRVVAFIDRTEQAQAMIGMGIPKAEVARTFGVSRQTLYTSLRRFESG